MNGEAAPDFYEANVAAAARMAVENRWVTVEDFPSRYSRATAAAALARVTNRRSLFAVPRSRETPPGRAPDLLEASMIDWGDFWTKDHKTEDWLIDPIVARGRSTVIHAEAKTGKSLLALFMAAHLALGRSVLSTAEGAPVYVGYVDMEMTEADVRERLADLGFGPDDDLGPLRYYLMPSIGALDTQEGGKRFVAMAIDAGLDVLIFDTLSRIVEGEENSADTIRAFARHTGSPLKAAGITVVRLDHTGKDASKGARGSSAKNEDADVVWSLGKISGGLQLKATHARPGWVPKIVNLLATSDPLAYHLAPDPAKAAVYRLVARLDDLGVPNDYGRNRSAQALRDAGEQFSTDNIAAAIKIRQERQPPGSDARGAS